MPGAPHEAFGSVMATDSTVSPLATAGRIARRCASLPASSTVSAPSTPELKKGPGSGARPSSSKSTATSVRALSLPPYSAGTSTPSQPSSAALRQSAMGSRESSRCSPTITCPGASRSTKARAAERSISWDSVSDRSIAASASVHRAGRLTRAAADADPSRHAHALDVRGAAGVDRDDAVALLLLQERLRRAPRRVGRERRRPHGLENGAGHPEPGHLAVVGELRALVGARALGVGQPEIAHAEEAHHLRLDVDVGQHVARVLLLDQAHAVALGLLAVREQPVPHAVAPDATAGAVLQLEVGAGRLPAVVLAADEREGGHAHLVEEHGVLLDGLGAALAAGAEQLHGLHGDARQVGVDHEPREVLVPLAARLRARDHPDAIRAVVAAHEDLLPGDHVVVAIADRRRGDAGEVGAGAGLGQELPGAHLAAVDRRQERLLLLLGAPHEDRRRAAPPAAVVVRRQRQAEAIGLFLEDDRVVHVEAAAAVLRGRARVEPAALTELAAESAQLAVAREAVGVVHGLARDASRHVGGEPRADLAAEALLLVGVGDLEVHSSSGAAQAVRARTNAPMASVARSASSSIGWNQCQTWIMAGHSSSVTSTPALRARSARPSASSSSTSSLPTCTRSGGRP